MATSPKIALHPYNAEREYTKLLLSYVKGMEIATLKTLKEHELLRLDDLGDPLSNLFRLDGWSDDLTNIMLALLERFLSAGQAVTLRLPEIYAQVNQFSDRQWRLVVKAGTGIDIGPAASVNASHTTMSSPGAIRARFGVGVDVYRTEPWLAEAQSRWVATNSALIKSVPTQYMAQVEQTIRAGVLAGESPKSLAKKIQAQGGVTENRAKLIAVDQCGKANGELNKYRQQDLGIKEYIWKTSRDERVRPLHQERQDKQFSWDKPPNDGHPGMPIRCRCSASPIFPD